MEGMVLTLIWAVLLLSIGYFFGKMDEKKHYRSIHRREEKLAHILLFNEKTPPIECAKKEFILVNGSAVVGSDYFRQVVAGIKQFFGGRLSSFESTLDRGRREAILRMKEEAESLGATMIFNVRLETATLTGNQSKKQGLFYAEFLAYGTAVC